MPGQDTSWSLQLAIVPKTSWYDSEDERWLDHIDELRHDLRPYLAVPRHRPQPINQRHKGIEELGRQVLLLLLAPPALRVALEALQTWLDKDRTRSFTATWSDAAGNQHILEVTSTGIGSADISALATELAKHLELGRGR